MMSRFAYLSFKDISAGKRVRFANLLLIPLVIIVIAIEPQVTILRCSSSMRHRAGWAGCWRRASQAAGPAATS